MEASSLATSSADSLPRGIAQQLTCAVDVVMSVSQYGLSTMAGGECVARAVETLSEFDTRAPVLSVNGIGAFDFISRGAMMDGLVQSVDGGDAALSFVRHFCGDPSQYLWEIDDGDIHFIQ